MTLPNAPRTPLSLDRSQQLLEEANAKIPGMTLSMMKRPEHFAPGHFPVFLANGRGALVSDVDGNEYIDFICGLGANSLGHQHAVLKDAIQNALERGFLHSLPHELEVQAANALLSAVPGAEMVRFFKTGADATSAAIRLARHLTKRERIVTIGYNGWHDHFMFDTPGVPEALSTLTTRLPLFVPTDEQKLLDLLNADGESYAAVLLSVPYNRPLNRDFLLQLRAVCSHKGIRLVFDEIVTGFRLALGGIQEFFGVTPDYSCYSKAMAGGLPLSAVVGPKEALSKMGELQVSTTFGGELLSLAATIACISTYQETGAIAHVACLGQELKNGINQVAESVGSPLRVIGYDAIPFFLFDKDRPRHEELMRQFQGLMAERGVLLRRDVNFICAAHESEQIQFTIEAAESALSHMSRTS